MTALKKVSVTLSLIGALTIGLAATMSSVASAQGQEDMNDAIQHLRQARGDLSHAASNKGGHRENAMHLIDQAISEVEAGKAYANSHPEERHEHRRDHDDPGHDHD